jgi:hypothetical protein
MTMRWPDEWKGPYWEPRDIWVGLYWTRDVAEVARWEAWETLSVYLCPIPCFPIRLRWICAVPSKAQRMQTWLNE